MENTPNTPAAPTELAHTPTEIIRASELPAQLNQREAFELGQRQAKALMSATMIPKDYQGNMGNCLIAVEMAQRLNMPVLEVLQNLYIVHGMPGWKTTFLIGRINASGKFSSLRYEEKGEGNDYACRAYAIEARSGERLNGTWITWVMVKAEGWDKKTGSKWNTMPEQMFKYRAAAFWQRAYAPEISMGLQSAEEVEDVTPTSKLRTIQAWGTLTPSLLAKAKEEIEHRISTADEVIKKAMLDPNGEQAQELRRIEKEAA